MSLLSPVTPIACEAIIVGMLNTTEPFVWFNSTEACHHLGVDRSTLREWRETAGLPHHPAGAGGYLYERGALDSWMAAHEAASRPVRVSRYAMPGRCLVARAEEREATVTPSPVT